MPYDPDDLYTAEPKLLSISCFPTFFTPTAPPNYDLIMAGNTQYHRVPVDNRVSMESSTGSAEVDAGLLLLDPTGSDDGESTPTDDHKFSCHLTAIFRFISVCVLSLSLVTLAASHRSRFLSTLILISIVLVRNLLVLLHHLFSKHIHIRIEFRNRLRSSGFPKPRRGCPSWLKSGLLHVALDLGLVAGLLATTIVGNQGAYGWRGHSSNAVATCILAYIGNLFYLLSVVDMGKPSNITVTSGISFNFGKDKRPENPQQQQVYRDVEVQAAGGLGVEIQSRSGKSGADSPMIV